MAFNVSFKDGVHITIFDEEDVRVNRLSDSDVQFNNIANKAALNETEYYRLLNEINFRLGVEVV